MQKRVIIVHGWDGYPEEGWFPWLKRELEARHFEVDVPQMPAAGTPRIEAWVPHLAKIITWSDQETFLIGHSIGCQTILRALEILPVGRHIKAAVLVAPFLEFLTLGDKTVDVTAEEAIATPWLTTPIDYERVRQQVDQIVAIFSDDDPYVPLANVQLFEDRLNAETIVVPKMGHFSGGDGTIEIPLVLKTIGKLDH
ncbi:MAG: alpha/beta fold hydrolase [Patescibacteria group bacterium]